MNPDTSDTAGNSCGSPRPEGPPAGVLKVQPSEGQSGNPGDSLPSISISLLGILAAGVIVKMGASVLIPLTVAFFLMLLLQPISSWTAKRVDSGLCRWRSRSGKTHKSEESSLANIFSIALVIILFLFLSSLFYFLVSGQVSLIIGKSNEIMSNIVQPLEELMVNSRLFGDAASVTAHIDGIKDSLLEMAPSAAMPIISVVFTFIMILFLTTFLLMGRRTVEGKLQDNPHFDRVEHIIRKVESSTRKFILAKIVTSFITGFAVWLILDIFFLPTQDAITWGLVYFVMNFIPIYGSMIAGAGAALYTMAIFNPSNFVSAWPVIPLLIVVNVTVSNGIEPKVMQSTLPIGPVTVLFVVILWAWLWGAWGMILAVPLSIMLKVMLEEIRGERYWLYILMEA